MDDLRLAIHQTSPHLGEVATNREEMLRRARASKDAHLVAFPELSLTGYSLRGTTQRHAVALTGASPLGAPAGLPPIAFGLPERGQDELVYNTAVLAQGDRLLLKHRKVYLPTYGVFDEGRYFARGREGPGTAVIPPGWKVGLLVCEDFWHPGLLYLLAVQGVDLVLVLSAAPGRGEPGVSHREEDPPPLFGSPTTWTLLARTAAVQYGVYLALVNRAGVEEGLTFAGGSMVVAPDGELLLQAPQGEEAELEVTLTRRGLRRARTPFAHLRDEDPAFLHRALDRLLRDG